MKCKKIILFVIIASLYINSYGQDVNFYVKAPDTVMTGKPFKVTYTLENAEGHIDIPEFYGIKVVGGPNHATSMTIVNGDKSQSLSVSYYLLAEESGEWVVERASVEIEGTYYETVPVTIVSTEKGPRNSEVLSERSDDLFSRFGFGRREIPVKPDKPKLSRKDSILLKHKVKKF